MVSRQTLTPKYDHISCGKTTRRTNANAAAPAASLREKKKELWAIEFFTLDYCIEDHQKCTGDDPLHLFFFLLVQQINASEQEKSPKRFIAKELL